MTTFNVAITGGIATGKSTIMTTLETRVRYAAIPPKFYSIDKIIRSLYQNDKHFKSWVLKEFNTTDRSAISNIVFDDSVKLAKLEKFTSTRIAVQLGRILSVPGINIVEIPLLFQYRLHTEFDLVIEMYVDKEEQVDRAILRDGSSRDKLESILNSQKYDLSSHTECNCYYAIPNKYEKDFTTTSVFNIIAEQFKINFAEKFLKA